MDGGGPLLSAWVAEERNRILGQELTEVEERAHADLARMAIEWELESWEQFKAPPLVKMETQSKDLVDTRWVLTWREADGVKTD